MKFTLVVLTAVSIFDAVIVMHSGEVEHDKVCIDDDQFYLKEDVTQNCLWIKNNEDHRQSFCPLPDVGENCPVTCGHCCDDRHDFRFPIGDGAPDLHGCDWLQSNDKAHCLRRFEGIEISYGCPKTCNACEAPIALPYDQATTEYEPIIIESGEIMLTPHVNQPAMAPRKVRRRKEMESLKYYPTELIQAKAPVPMDLAKAKTPILAKASVRAKAPVRAKGREKTLSNSHAKRNPFKSTGNGYK